MTNSVTVMKCGRLVMKLLQLFGHFPFTWNNELRTFHLNKCLIVWCVLQNMSFIAAAVCYYFQQKDGRVRVKATIFIILALSKAFSLARSRQLARVIARIRNLRPKREICVPTRRSDILMVLSLILLIYGNVWVLYDILQLMLKSFKDNEVWWAVLPRFYMLTCCLSSLLLILYAFCLLVRNLTVILRTVVPPGFDENSCLFNFNSTMKLKGECTKDHCHREESKDEIMVQYDSTSGSDSRTNCGSDTGVRFRNPDIVNLGHDDDTHNQQEDLDRESETQPFSDFEGHDQGRTEVGKIKIQVTGEVDDVKNESLSEEQLSRAEALLLKIDLTIADLMDYMGPYLLCLLLSLVLALAVFLYSFVKTFVKSLTPNWCHIIIFAGCGLSFIYLNTTTDEFNDERAGCAQQYRKILHLRPQFQTNLTIYRLLWLLDRRVEFTVAGFVTLGRSHVATTVSLIISYVVIALQFWSAGVTYNQHPAEAVSSS